jgi:hypothetical protein
MLNVRPGDLVVNGAAPTNYFESATGGSTTNPAQAAIAAAAAQAAAQAAGGGLGGPLGAAVPVPVGAAAPAVAAGAATGGTTATVAGQQAGTGSIRPAGGAGGALAAGAAQQAAAAGAIAAGQAAGVRANAAQAAVAAQAAAQGVALALATSVDPCLVIGATLQGVTSQVRQLNGPGPDLIDRLPPGATGTFTWDYVVQALTDPRGQLAFQGLPTAETPAGPVVGTAAQSFPLQTANHCFWLALEATPAAVVSGGVLDVNMRAQNISQVTPPRDYNNVYPQPLRVVVDSGNPALQLLSGPLSAGLAGRNGLGQGQTTAYNWRYQVSGDGCFHLLGAVDAQFVPPYGGSTTSNTVSSDPICVATAPRGRASGP